MKLKSLLNLGLMLGVLMLPVFTSEAQTVTRITAGYYNSFFIKSDGSLWGMGQNLGSLGDGTYNNTNRPEQIVASNVTGIAAAGGSLFLKTDGSLWGMGPIGTSLQYGDLGGFYYPTNQPEQMVPGNVTAIAAAGSAGYILFLKSDGSLWGMGYNAYGELGDGIARTYPYIGTNSPEQIVASGVTAIAAGGDHSLFLKSNGSLWGMGDNGWGQLGDGTTNGGNYATNLPEQIVASGVVAIAAGFYHSMFLKNDGSLWAMGLNNFGQLGNGTIINANVPQQIVASNVTAISAGGYHSLFLKSDGSLWSMGRNEYGQLGLGTTNFMEVHLSVQIVPLVIPVSLYASYNSADNGSFETGDFTDYKTGYPLGWDLSGNISPDTMVSTKSGYAHSGTYGAQCGPVGSLVYLSQTLPTIPGATYLLSFWLDSPDGATPNEFLASWNGATLLDKTNLIALGWTNLQFAVTATGTSTLVQFGFRDDKTYFGLDDVSVTRMLQPTMTSISSAGANLVIQGSNGLFGVTYRTLMSTNLVQPLNQWLPVATNVLGTDGNFTITVTDTVNPSVRQRFYSLQLQ